MAGDDLEAPLGLNDQGKSRKFPLGAAPNLPFGPLIAGLLALCLLAFVGWALIVEDPLGGEPAVVVSLKPDPATAKPTAAAAPIAGADNAPAPDSAPASAAAAPTPAKTAAAGQTVTIIDGTSGKRQEISLPQGDVHRQAAIDTRLLETTRHGPVPRIGLDGARSSTAYARTTSPANPTAPRIAIVVAGLGVSAAGTAEAIKKLPAAVTFAFAPHAADLERVVARARGEGHEALLQIPMEPLDYPDNDPGPHTLLTSLAPEQNIDRMHWLMSRFQGYVGLVNAMGARFTATETAIAPVLRETAKRGLLYLDDGSSPRSLAGQIAGANNLPFARANVVIDAVPSQAEVDRALVRLEQAARDQGFAVGIASTLPLSVNRLAQWAKTAEQRGFSLVPITAIAFKAKGS